MVKDSRRVHKSLLGIVNQECVKDVVNLLDYLPYFLHEMWGCMC